MSHPISFTNNRQAFREAFRFDPARRTSVLYQRGVLARRDGAPVFGPESPIATRDGCERAGGRFLPSVFGWMVHANAFLGDDLDTVFGHGH